MYLLEFAGDDDTYAAAEAATVADEPSAVGPGLAVASAIDRDRVGGLAFTRWASDLVGRTGSTVEAAVELLEAAAIDRSGTVAVRARNVRGTAAVDTQAVERALGTVLVGRGFDVDLESPDHELRAVFSGEECLLGWLVVQARRGFGGRKPTERPFFQPGSMDPIEARAVANLAGAAPGVTVLDPMCGTGGLLIEAGLVGARLVGFDAQWAMVRGCRENLRRYLDGGYAVGRADATRLPVRDRGVDAVVVDVPYGRQSAVAGGEPADLIAGVLGESHRVVDRAVIVADRPVSDAARSAGWAVEGVYDRPVHRSLTRHVHVLRTGAR